MPRKLSRKKSRKQSRIIFNKLSKKEYNKQSRKQFRKQSRKSRKMYKTNTTKQKKYYSMIKKYIIFNNSGKDYTVYVIPLFVSVYNFESKKVLDTSYTDIFVGDNYLDIKECESQGKYLGNTILLKISDGKYVFIGNEIFSFNTIDNEEIIKYYSPKCDNTVSYPYAIGKNNTYFMIEGQYVSNKILDLTKDCYKQFYFDVEENDKKIFKYKMIDNEMINNKPKMKRYLNLFEWIKKIFR